MQRSMEYVSVRCAVCLCSGQCTVHRPFRLNLWRFKGKGLVDAPPGAVPILTIIIKEENYQPSSKRQFSSESLLQGLTC